MVAKVALGALLLTSSLMANAEIIIGDWKTEGDGLIRLDTNSGLEWIDTELTFGRSINDLQETFGEGGEFEGFRVAGKSDVEEMVNSLLSDVNPEGFTPYKTEYDNENDELNTFTTGTDKKDIELTDSKIFSEIFESYFSTFTTEKSFSDREEEIFLYDRFLYLSDDFDVFVDGDISNDVLTLSLYVNQKYEGQASSSDESNFTLNNVNGYLQSAYASIFLVSDDLVSYSSLNDSSYLKAKESGIANVNTPLSLLSLFSVAGLGFLRKRKFK